MTKPFDSLDETFDIEPTETEIVPMEDAPKEITKSEKEREQDHQLARENIHFAMNMMRQGMEESMENAIQSGHPRAWEVFFNGAKAMVDASSSLEKIQNDKTSTEEGTAEGPKITTQNNFLMTTADLQKLLKEQQSDK